MEFIIRIVKIAVIVAVIYIGYMLYKKTGTDNNTVYNIETEIQNETVESPKSLIGKTFISDDGFEFHLKKDNTCDVVWTIDNEGFEIKGTPQYKYKKTEGDKAILNVKFQTILNKKNSSLEDEYTYRYEMKFTKPHKGKVHCNYIIIHKINVNEKIRSYVEANTRPTWFELK